MRLAATALILFLTSTAPATWASASSADAEARLHQLFDAEWERGLRDDPLQATYRGDHRYDDRWPDLAAAAPSRP